MADTQPIIPPEAIRAVAEQIASDDGGNYDSGSGYDRQGYDDAAEAYIRAALPHLPQHVSPSVEDAQEEAAQRYLSYGVSPEGKAFVAGAQWASSSQPTVEQVRRETLLSAADDFSVNLTAMSGPRIREWLRARAAEAVDPRG